MRFMRAACAVALAALFSGSAQAKALHTGARNVDGAATAVARGPGNVPYGGGPVLHSNRTHLIFWQPAGSGLTYDPGYESVVETFLANVAAASHSNTSTYSLTGQYTDSGGPAFYDSTYGGSVVATDPLPANGCTEPTATSPGWTVCLTDSQLQTEIMRVIRAHRLPTGSDDIYFLVTPSGLGSCLDSSSTACALGGSPNGYCGYHGQTTDGLVSYAVIPYNAVAPHCSSDNPRPNGSAADPALSTISHEQIEMVTDPEGNAWIDNSDEEIADRCIDMFGPPIGGSGSGAWNQVINGGHYFLQEVWSNATGACEQRPRPDSVWFRAAPTIAHSTSVSFTAHATDPDGVIVAYRWYFGDHRIGYGSQVSHQFAHRGSYRVVLRTTDSWGNWTFFARTVRVRRAAGSV